MIHDTHTREHDRITVADIAVTAVLLGSVGTAAYLILELFGSW